EPFPPRGYWSTFAPTTSRGSSLRAAVSLRDVASPTTAKTSAKATTTTTTNSTTKTAIGRAGTITTTRSVPVASRQEGPEESGPSDHTCFSARHLPLRDQAAAGRFQPSQWTTAPP